jgi:phage terminase small subunit
MRKTNAHIRMLENAESRMFQILRELGLTPREREKVTRTAGSKAKKFAPGTIGAMLQDEGVIP